MILGRFSGGGAANLSAGTLLVWPVTVPADVSAVALIGAHIDGLGPASGTAKIVPVIYAANKLLAAGPAIDVPSGAPEQWLTARLDVPGVAVAGAVKIGLWVGGVGNVARLWRVAQTAAGQAVAAASGPPATLAGASAYNFEGVVFAEVFAGWTPPAIEDAALARLPWAASQQALSATGPLSPTLVTAEATWHGTRTDPERGANCIARSDGPLADRVGERLRIVHRYGTLERVVYAYCHDEMSFPAGAGGADLSLSRPAFMRLAPLSTDRLTVRVVTLA